MMTPEQRQAAYEKGFRSVPYVIDGWQTNYDPGAHAAGLAEVERVAAVKALREGLAEAADLIEPFSGIGLANGATRADVARWLRARAAEIPGDE